MRFAYTSIIDLDGNVDSRIVIQIRTKCLLRRFARVVPDDIPILKHPCKWHPPYVCWWQSRRTDGICDGSRRYMACQDLSWQVDFPDVSTLLTDSSRFLTFWADLLAGRLHGIIYCEIGRMTSRQFTRQISTRSPSLVYDKTPTIIPVQVWKVFIIKVSTLEARADGMLKSQIINDQYGPTHLLSKNKVYDWWK